MYAPPTSPAASQALERTFERAMGAAGRALAEMSGHAIEVVATEVAHTSARNVVDAAGGAGTVVVGIYVGITGSVDGHALLVLQPEGARKLASLLLDGFAEPGLLEVDEFGVPSLDELELSALREVGNVTVGAFLNEPVVVTVPIAISDMAGAILDAVLADLTVDTDEVLAARTSFINGGDTIEGAVLVLPRQASLAALTAALGAA
jgi:chemotaxis protein CheY-P-specific phosphatase CheC